MEFPRIYFSISSHKILISLLITVNMRYFGLQGIRSPFLDYSHFVSLPLAIHPELVEKLNDFQNSIIGDNHASDEGNVNDTQFQDVDTTVEVNHTSTRSNSSKLAGSEVPLEFHSVSQISILKT